MPSTKQPSPSSVERVVPCTSNIEELVEEGVSIQLTDEDDIWNAGAIKEELAVQGV